MSHYSVKNTCIIALGVILLLYAGSVLAQGKVVDIQFNLSPDSLTDIVRTLHSLVKVQGQGGLCQDALYLITQYGAREELFKAENQRSIDHPLINETWRFCSIFSSGAENAAVMGRNFDNQNVGAVIINLNRPSQGYNSISFSRAMDLGFPLNVDLEQIKDTDFGKKLLLAPFYSTDGINEHGLAVATAGVGSTTLEPAGGRQRLFVTFLLYKILDGAKNVDEAISLIGQFMAFDLDQYSLNTHLYVADSSGKSAVLEYKDNRWCVIYSDKSWQVLTNKPICDVADSTLREICWRYKSMSEGLERTGGVLDWGAGLEIMKDVSQKGTVWSVIYCLRTKEIYFSVYQNWDVVYHLRRP